MKNIIIERNALLNAEKYINLNRKVLIVTDENIPEEYITAIGKKCERAIIFKIKPGEESKSLKSFEKALLLMLENNFNRYDAVVSIGGGVCGDLGGFIASCFMRGIEFYNIPTSLLSQVDSSVGGKTAVNLSNVKNVVGAFYPPSFVIIDSNTLKTLPKREFASGLAEVIKMAVTLDSDFFEFLENCDFVINIDEIIKRAIEIKMSVVSKDLKEAGLRRVLNFGHTIGHGIETTTNYNHGESVALGMLPMCSENVRASLIKILKKADLPTNAIVDSNKIINAVTHDKKAEDDLINIVKCENVGAYSFEKADVSQIEKMMKEVF